MNNRIYKVRDLCFIGIFTAVIAIFAQISIPMPFGVPITLQTLVIPLAGIILGAKKGALSALVYILLGAVGIPVFAGFRGGLGIVFGPTGGFILSFPLMAFTAGISVKKRSRVWLFFWLSAGAAINHLCGMLMYSHVMSCTLGTAFIDFLPFIPMAFIKAALSGIIGPKLKSRIPKLQAA